MNTENQNSTERPPVVAVMGHIDHGKSTLLSYIRKSKKPLNEAGGITQHISAYEIICETPGGRTRKITFLDTPGHEAFCGIRKRGAGVADIAVLVVSAEDGVKPQTLEALGSIKESKTPFVVAINKIDKPEANIERTKQSLAENEIYVEGYGGDIPVVCISAVTGEGVPELLDMISLIADLENLTGNPKAHGSGIIIESNRDVKKGVSATCIIKDGMIQKGEFVVAGVTSAPVRIMENYLGKAIPEALFGTPVKITGWDILPEVGEIFTTCKTRDEVKVTVEQNNERKLVSQKTTHPDTNDKSEVLLVVKADTGSSLEAVLSEIQKLSNEKIKTRVISSGIGVVSENDVRLANGTRKALIIGFHTSTDSPARNLAERSEVDIKIFDIIYKMTEWLTEILKTRAPKTKIEESTGKAKILKVFSKVRDKQILGARVESGSIRLGAEVRITRRDAEIGIGKVKELQKQKNKTDEVSEGEFGTLIEAKVEIAPGDKIESFIIIEK